MSSCSGTEHYLKLLVGADSCFLLLLAQNTQDQSDSDTVYTDDPGQIPTIFGFGLNSWTLAIFQ